MSNDATGARRPRRDADTPGAAADPTTRGGPAPSASKTGASVGNAAAAGSSGRGGSAPGSPAQGSPETGAAAAGATADGNQAGPELARAVLDAAKARRQAAAPRRRTTRGGGEGGERRLRGYSGPGPDPRDPQLLGAVLARIVKARGWQQPTAEATVFGAWGRVVGAEIATHSRPVKLEEGVLTVEAESTAWATQLRLLSAALLQKIAREVGHNVVTRLNIHGPAAPSWSRGPRRVRGRGPRDTYG